MAKVSTFGVRRKLTFKPLIIFLILIIFIYLEFFTYWTLPLSWIETPNCQESTCKKLLLISDPQIIGPEWYGFSPLDSIAIWDSDRYLRRTFLSAVKYIQPDFIIFLGDLMDQGHTASDEEFESYMARLKMIFKPPTSLSISRVIISPGDNDIGGVEDVLIPRNVQRFDRLFNQSEDTILTQYIEFCKVNLMTATLQQSKFLVGDIVRVALSHVPLVPKESYFLREVVKKIKPHLIFSGHVHTSSHYTAHETDVWSHKHSDILPTDIRPRIYKFHEGLIHEIIVPTCSYRMGVNNMGYGAAFIDVRRRLVHYNVLWLPGRFPQLLFHFIVMLPLVVGLLLQVCKKWKRHRQQKCYNTFHASLP